MTGVNTSAESELFGQLRPDSGVRRKENGKEEGYCSN